MPLIHSNLLLTLHYLAEISPGELAAEHRTWRERHSDPLITHRMTLHRTRESERRLRVGYVSPDFRDHPIVRFITPLLAAHDRGQTEAICYADHGVDDPVTAEVEKLSDAWHRVGSLTDEQLATRVRDDGIDILVDLAGHTSRGRLRAFALKPAPVQVTYLGYPNTTGLDTIDYRLVDAWSDPPGLTDPYCTEKLWRLPRTAWCYRPPNHAAVPAVSSRLARGEFHFGSFNTLAKLSPVTLELWADVLRAIPRAKLVLKAKALTDKPGRRATAAQFARLGIDPSRLIFLPWARTAGDHLAAYENIDVALDSFPYHGTTTTCDALWMGVPVVTLAGEMHHSRVGVSLLQNAGQADCIATSRADFVQRAVSLVQEPEKLAARRKELRAQMAASPLRDEAGFARDFEAALRAMWRTYCQSPAS